MSSNQTQTQTQTNPDPMTVAHVTTELCRYYYGQELRDKVQETLSNFNVVGMNPLHFRFMEESRVNQTTFRTETAFIWQRKQMEDSSDGNGSILIKD